LPQQQQTLPLDNEITLYDDALHLNGVLPSPESTIESCL